jgi:hypothetical protein
MSWTAPRNCGVGSPADCNSQGPHNPDHQASSSDRAGQVAAVQPKDRRSSRPRCRLRKRKAHKTVSGKSRYNGSVYAACQFSELCSLSRHPFSRRAAFRRGNPPPERFACRLHYTQPNLRKCESRANWQVCKKKAFFAKPAGENPAYPFGRSLGS